jgi:DHA1 family multidrug resistance protein-like MFS transporter
MFTGMGIQWACTLLGCLAIVMVPVPVWFYLRGAEIRKRSKFAPTAAFPLVPKEKEEA